MMLVKTINITVYYSLEFDMDLIKINFNYQ